MLARNFLKTPFAKGASTLHYTKRCAKGSSIIPLNRLCKFDEDMTAVQEMARRFAKERLAPMAYKIDRDDWFPIELWPEMGELGLHGITVPEKYGGVELNYTAQAIIMEELSRASGGIGLSWAAHSNLCINQLVRNGSEEQKMKYLPKLCTGEHIGALAMSESSAGSDVTSMKLTAKQDGDHYILNGSKLWITNGPYAETLIVYAKTDITPGAKGNGITCFIVEKDTPGFSIAQKLDKLGMRGSPTGEQVFEDCRVHKDQIMGGLNKGVYVLFSGLDLERLVLSAGPVGLMQEAFDVTMDYVRTREQFGKPIGEFQLMQGKIADMYTKLQSSRAFLYSLTRLADEGHFSNTDCASCILLCTDNAIDVTMEAIQALGGNGYINEYSTGRQMRDAKLYAIGAGTQEIRRWLIGRELNKNYPWKDEM